MAANARVSSILSLGWHVFLLTLGAIISAFGVIVFEAPFKIAPGGISGVAIILNNLIHTPIGLIILIGNIPIQIFAYRMLGG
ncbi:MAG: YitT family protein, partial [Chloroflexota bacterium]